MTVTARKIPTLRFPEFEGEWEEKKLGEIADFFDSKRVPLSELERQDKKGVYPYYGASGIIDYVDDYIFDGTYVLLGEDGANIISRSTRLAFVVVGKIWVNNHAHVIRSFGNDYFLAEALEKIRYEQYNTGTVQPKLNADICKKIKLHVPSLPEQQKIATFLTTIDTRIQQLSRKKALLEQYKKGVMQQIFSQEIRFKDEDGKEFSAWEEKRLGDLAKIYDGTHQTPNYVDNGVPFYSVEHITRDNFKDTKLVSEDVFEKENQRVKLEKGDILMTRIGDIGTSKYISWEVRASFYVSLALIKQSPLFNSRFMNQFIQSIFFQKELHKRTIHVAFPKKINLGEIGNCFVKLPSPPEQQKIADFLSTIDRQINLVSQQLERMQTFKKGLLQQMFV